MKKKRFSVEQIVAVLKQSELGVPVPEVIRKVGISEQTFHRWKKQYVGMETDQARQIKQLQSGEQPVEAAGCRSESGQDDAAGCAQKKVVKPSDGRSFTRPVSDEPAGFQTSLQSDLKTSVTSYKPEFAQTSHCGR